MGAIAFEMMERHHLDSETVGKRRMCMIGAWSARATFVLELAYVVVFVVGFASVGDLSKPLPDPYLAIAEALILVIAPILVILMLAIHDYAPERAKPFTQVAIGWMLATAAFTTTVHFVELTVARHINPATFPGYYRVFDFKWPSLLYAVDIVAWDVFFALALLFAIPAFARDTAPKVRAGFFACGVLCLIGLVGPFANVLGLRAIGIFGYTILFAATCLPLSRAFSTRATRYRTPPST
jgi:hypothetical protein